MRGDLVQEDQRRSALDLLDQLRFGEDEPPIRSALRSANLVIKSVNENMQWLIARR